MCLDVEFHQKLLQLQQLIANMFVCLLFFELSSLVQEGVSAFF